MRRLLLFLVLAISQSWLVAQAPNLTTTNGEPNGVWWNTNVNSSEKVTFAIGFSIGVAVAGTPGITGTLPVCPTFVKDWSGTYTMADVAREIDKFYGNPVNLPLPVHVAAVHSHMKLAGATQDQLDTYRTRELEFLARQSKEAK